VTQQFGCWDATALDTVQIVATRRWSVWYRSNAPGPAWALEPVVNPPAKPLILKQLRIRPIARKRPALAANDCGSILEGKAGDPEVLPNFFSEAYTRMPSEPLPDLPPAEETTAGPEPTEATELPVDLSEFSQRLASFGLGETPDPLLTQGHPPHKRRSPK
jgi:hypothetical protein